jgi:hypothetical protein
MCRAARSAAALALVPFLALSACKKEKKESEPAPADTAAPPPADPAADPAADLPATPVSPEPASAPGDPPSEPAEKPTEPAMPSEPAEKPSEQPSEPARPSEPAEKPSESPERGDESERQSASLPAQGETCDQGQCGKGLTCVEYYGIAGPRGPRMSSCEIPCKGGGGCPDGQQCATIADGPGQVCRPGT